MEASSQLFAKEYSVFCVIVLAVFINNVFLQFTRAEMHPYLTN